MMPLSGRLANCKSCQSTKRLTLLDNPPQPKAREAAALTATSVSLITSSRILPFINDPDARFRPFSDRYPER